jgi:hypothetical protein
MIWRRTAVVLLPNTRTMAVIRLADKEVSQLSICRVNTRTALMTTSMWYAMSLNRNFANWRLCGWYILCMLTRCAAFIATMYMSRELHCKRSRLQLKHLRTSCWQELQINWTSCGSAALARGALRYHQMKHVHVHHLVNTSQQRPDRIRVCCMRTRLDTRAIGWC